jgi:hypothetical protein
MRPGHGEVVIADGDVELAEDRERLVREFRRQLDEGLWAAVPMGEDRREAKMVTSFDEVPENAERVIFFPRAAGGSAAYRSTAQTAAYGSAAQTAAYGSAAQTAAYGSAAHGSVTGELEIGGSGAEAKAADLATIANARPNPDS